MGGASSAIKHGPLVYDQAGRVATIDGQMLELSARELGLLEVLLQRAGRLVSKDQLVERLCEWGEEVSNNAIEVYIHRLRKKIEKGPVRIATVRGLGYCLEKIPGDDDAARRHARAAARRRPRRDEDSSSARSARCSARSSTGCSRRCCCWGPSASALTWLVAQNIAGNAPFDRALEYNVQALAKLVVVKNNAGAVHAAAARARDPARRRHRPRLLPGGGHAGRTR